MSNPFTKLKERLARYLDVRVIFILDVFISFVASTLVLLVADVLGMPVADANHYFLWWILTTLIATIIMFAVFRTHRIIIRHSNLKDLFKIALAVLGKDGITAVVLLFTGMAALKNFG